MTAGLRVDAAFQQVNPHLADLSAILWSRALDNDATKALG